MTGPVWLGVAALGAVGSLARVAVSTFVSRRRHSPFPLGTLAVNLSGGFVLGLLVGARVDGAAMTLAGTGLLGAFTTFSTWMVETEQLARDRRWAPAALNVGLPLALGLAATGLGWALGALLG